MNVWNDFSNHMHRIVITTRKFKKRTRLFATEKAAKAAIERIVAKPFPGGIHAIELQCLELVVADTETRMLTP